MQVCRDTRAETRFHFRAGITSAVPWLVVIRLEASRARLAMAKPRLLLAQGRSQP
jgi:hypothetical protein